MARSKALGGLSPIWRCSDLGQRKCLSNIVGQDHRRLERLIRPGLGLKGFHTARRPIAGYEIMAMIRKGHVTTIPDKDMPAQSAFIATPFGVAA